MKRWLVGRLEDLCTLTHWITHHRPWLWLPGVHVCQLAMWSSQLDERWGTGVWEKACPYPDGVCTCANGIGCVNVPFEKW